MITNEIRKQRIREISEEVFSVYTSTEITQAIKQSIVTYQIANKDAFVDCVGDTIIGLIPRIEFEKKLVSDVGVNPDYVAKITLSFKPFFDKAEGVARPEANLETKERLELRPNVSAPTQATAGAPNQVAPQNPTGAKPLTREELMNALGGRRTMASDIEAVRQKREEYKSQPPQQ
jgi:hypothetical protein